MSAPETQEQTLTAFLLARIEDERLTALECRSLGVEHPLGQFSGWVEIGSEETDVVEDLLSRYTTARVLAECAAKRRIVEEYQEALAVANPDDFTEGLATGLGDAVLALASVYADHPDFRQEWGL